MARCVSGRARGLCSQGGSENSRRDREQIDEKMENTDALITLCIPLYTRTGMASGILEEGQSRGPAGAAGRARGRGHCGG